MLAFASLLAFPETWKFDKFGVLEAVSHSLQFVEDLFSA
jgi:hypothetical protein